MKFNDANDLKELEANLKFTPIETKRKVLAVIFKVGLAKLPWYIRFLNNLFVKGLTNPKFDPKHVNAMWDDMIHHIVRGTDSTKQNKVGGYNEQEFEILLDILETFGLQLK